MQYVTCICRACLVALSVKALMLLACHNITLLWLEFLAVKQASGNVSTPYVAVHTLSQHKRKLLAV